MDQLPRLGKRELICLLLFTCNYVVFVWRGFFFLWVLGMGYVILLWHSLSLPYNFYLSIDHKVLFHNAYIKPHLDYCSLIWSNISNVNINKITKLQRRSCKLILGQEYNGLIEAFERLNMLSFDQSIFLSKAKLMYKVQNNLAPVYLNEMFLKRDTTLNNTASKGI